MTDKERTSDSQPTATGPAEEADQRERAGDADHAHSDHEQNDDGLIDQALEEPTD